MPVQVKINLRFDGKTVVALMPKINIEHQRMGVQAVQGADGPFAMQSGQGRTHMLSGIVLRVPVTGAVFDPWQHTEVGTEFDASYDEGDPALGGKRVNLIQGLCKGVRISGDNENGVVEHTFDAAFTTRSP